MWHAQGLSGSQINQFAALEVRFDQDARNHTVGNAFKNKALEADVGGHDVHGRVDGLAKALLQEFVLQSVLAAEDDHRGMLRGFPVESVAAVPVSEVRRGHAQVLHVAQVMGHKSLKIRRGRGDGSLHLARAQIGVGHGLVIDDQFQKHAAFSQNAAYAA